jgi:hypothetical protein
MLYQVLTPLVNKHMNTDLKQRTTIGRLFHKMFPIVTPDIFVSCTFTVERAQYLLDYYTAMYNRDFKTAEAIGLGSPRDLETLELEKQAAGQEAAAA